MSAVSQQQASFATLPERAKKVGEIANTHAVYADDNGKLAVRELQIAWRREDSVLVASGLAEGEAVITSALAAPVPGMPLRRDTRGTAAGEVGGDLTIGTSAPAGDASDFDATGEPEAAAVAAPGSDIEPEATP